MITDKYVYITREKIIWHLTGWIWEICFHDFFSSGFLYHGIMSLVPVIVFAFGLSKSSRPMMWMIFSLLLTIVLTYKVNMHHFLLSDFRMGKYLLLRAEVALFCFSSLYILNIFVWLEILALKLYQCFSQRIKQD